MSRLEAAFAALRRRGEKGLIPFFAGGDPDMAVSQRLCLAAARSGADVIEVGLPFSDPLADGPVIQQANQRALRAGASAARVLELIDALRRQVAQPLVLLSYYNPLFQYGVERFLADAAAAGLDGLIVADLPFEESAEVRALAAARGIDPICLLAPTSTEERIATQVRDARGFIYCVSLTGVTGARDRLSARAAELVARVRGQTGLPIALGFGISSPAQVEAACRHADAAVVGSAIVQAAAGGYAAGGPAAAEQAVASLVAALKASLRSRPHLP